MSISGHVSCAGPALGAGPKKKKVRSGNCHENKLFPRIESYPNQFVQTSTQAVSQTVESCQFVTVAGDSWQLNLV